VALAQRDVRGLRARVVDTVRELPGLWLGLAGLSATVLTVRVQALPGGLVVPRDPGVASEAVWLFFRQVLPGLLSGPWTGEVTTHSVHYEVLWPFALAVVVTGLLVGFGLREAGSRFRWAMSALVAYLVLSLTLLSSAAGDSLVVALGTVPRHATDLVPALVLLTAAGLSAGVRAPRVIQGGFGGRLSARSSRGVTAVATLALGVVASAATVQVMIPDLLNEDDRAYVDNLRAGLAADTRVVLVDGPVPEGVMSAWFEDDARVSTVVGALPERPLFDLPSSTLRMVDEDGRLRQVALAGALRMRDSEHPDCGYPIDHVPRAIPLTGAVSGAQHVMRIGYYTDTSTYAVLELPGSVSRFPVNVGLHEIEVVVDEPFTEVVMSLEDTATTVCVAALHVGRPVPGQ
ncbi:hypothetical protein, partial [Nocardioides sp.]|uniref:hypothetical protein n=1 Tax=Nocardioides sp. TaxID=35761 RepID=UPI002734213F